MKEYPTEITARVLGINAHITDEEIAQDIADTEREISDYQRTMCAERELAHAHPIPTQRRLADFSAGARPYQIEERQRFVDFLKRLKAARTVNKSAMRRDANGGET